MHALYHVHNVHNCERSHPVIPCAPRRWHSSGAPILNIVGMHEHVLASQGARAHHQQLMGLLSLLLDTGMCVAMHGCSHELVVLCMLCVPFGWVWCAELG